MADCTHLVADCMHLMADCTHLVADCMQFLLENHLNGCQIFGRFGFFLKSESIQTEFRFYAHPYCLSVMLTGSVSGYFLYIAAVLVRCSR